MKFEQKYPTALSNERFEFEYSYVTKSPKLGQCRWCSSFTKWIDVLFQVNVCSEECNAEMWHRYRNDQKLNGTYKNFEDHFEQVKKELKLGEKATDDWKDILIVVHDQLDYIKDCVDSVQKYTKNYHLFIWDNASGKETQEYIQNLLLKYDPNKDKHYKLTTIRREKNVGFVVPNNEMIALGESPYIILLNSDTKVFENWDNTMIAFLKNNPEYAQVGYWGGHLNADGRGFGGANGERVDYIPGWCFCIPRETYDQFGLFDEHLKFAYCEDSDFSLRLKEGGKKIYSLYAPLVHHYQNKTVKQVEKEGELDLQATFDHNHSYFKNRWKEYLSKNRVLLDQK